MGIRRMAGAQVVKNESSASIPCPVCASISVGVLLNIPQVPVHCNLLWPTSEAAKGAPRGDIRLGYCEECGHIFNLAFDPGLMHYSQAYENSLHFSLRFQEYAHSLAERLVSRYSLRGKEIIEIGCGKGDFLRLLCELGDNHGVGFDPSYVPDGADEASGRTEFIRDVYSERYSNYRADLVCCRHVLEHLDAPTELLSMLRRTVGGRRSTVLFFEVPNVLFILRDLAIWDLIYEHRSYFSPNSLARAFTSCGFRVYELTEEYQGQFLRIEATAIEDHEGSDEYAWFDTREIGALVTKFAEEYNTKLENWRRTLEELALADKSVVVWGAGSKGVSFLNALKNADQIEYVIDINPRKQGMFVGGAGQEIVPPEALVQIRPQVVIVMNPIYESEIQEVVNSLGLDTEFLYA